VLESFELRLKSLALPLFLVFLKRQLVDLFVDGFLVDGCLFVFRIPALLSGIRVLVVAIVLNNVAILVGRLIDRIIDVDSLHWIRCLTLIVSRIFYVFCHVASMPGL
jgi:hypothetical protein